MDQERKIPVGQFIDELLNKSVEERSFTVSRISKEDGSNELNFSMKQDDTVNDVGDDVGDALFQGKVWDRLQETIKRNALAGRT